MAKTKEPSVTDQIAYYEQEIERERNWWNTLKEHGGSDPFWPDGVNMNLVRNHIIYYLRQLQELRRDSVQLSMFGDSSDCSVVPLQNDPRIPPLVDSDYMAPGHTLRISRS